MTWKSLASATLHDSRATLMTVQTSQTSHQNLNQLKVDESWRSNESESCDSHPRLIRLYYPYRQYANLFIFRFVLQYILHRITHGEAYKYENNRETFLLLKFLTQTQKNVSAPQTGIEAATYSSTYVARTDQYSTQASHCHDRYDNR